MGVNAKRDIYVGDFETTVYKEQKRTDVWASALTRLFDDTDHVEVHSSIDEAYQYILDNIHANCIIYYHNLKFDGEFWICYLADKLGYKQAYNEKKGLKIYEGTRFERELPQGEFLPDDKMLPCTFKYLISDMGAWYMVTIKRPDGYIIELRDSLKLIPCSVRKMGKDFGTKHRKTEIEYEGYRVPGGYISEQEREYIANDVLVVKEVLEIMYNEGHKRLTIGSCCFAEFKKIIGDYPRNHSRYDEMFPKLEDMPLDVTVYGDTNVDAYIRRAYHGGWCYVKEDIANKPLGKGFTDDVNSLYPSVMSGESGNRYPLDVPFFFRGEEGFNKIKNEEKFYYFVRVRTRFYLKPNYLPFIQIKRNKLYKSTEMLKTSDVLYKGKYLKYMRNADGETVPTSVVCTFTKTDWELVQKHYYLEDTEILDGCYFYTSVGVFDTYIKKYRTMKENSPSGSSRRSIAKLFLNSLYGKLSAGTNSSFKHLRLGESRELESETIFESNKKAGYIAIGAAITSYARCFTITAAQANYNIFCYADTDSCHMLGDPEDAVGIPVHESKFLHWKTECRWDQARFVRQKTYAEHVTMEDEEPVKEPYWSIKCAGLPDRCKKLLTLSIKGIDKVPKDAIMKMKLSERELEFVKVKRTIDDFKKGLSIPGKLMPIHIPGGVVLTDVDFTINS